MMKKVILAFSFVVVFVAGIGAAAYLQTGSRIVTVELKNNSGKKIETIEIVQELVKVGKVRHQVEGMAAGTAKTFRMYAPAESSFDLIVTFSDGKKIVQEEGYVEAGNRVIETIGTKKIESKTILMGSYKQ